MSSESHTQNGDTTVEDQLLELAKSKPVGITNDDIRHQIPDISLPEITAVINKCLKNG